MQDTFARATHLLVLGLKAAQAKSDDRLYCILIQKLPLRALGLDQARDDRVSCI